MPSAPSRSEKDILLKAAEEVIAHYGVETELLGSPEFKDYFFNGVMIFNVLATPNFKKKRKKFDKPALDYGVRVAAAAKKLGLGYVVLSASYRKDMRDGGASYLAHYIREIKKANPDIIVEALMPDYDRKEFIEIVLKAKPDVIAQNIANRLVKSKARFELERALKTTEIVRQLNRHVPIRATIRLGMDENMFQVVGALRRLRKAGVDMVLIGKNDTARFESKDYYEHLIHERFEFFERSAYQLGYRNAISKLRLAGAYAIPEFISCLSESKK